MKSQDRGFQATTREGSRQLEAPDTVDLFWSLSPLERERQFVTTSEAAHQIGISRRTLQNWVQLGEVRAIKVGKNYRVLLASVKARLIDSHDI
jgi:excisionase family DNA binding protein